MASATPWAAVAPISGAPRTHMSRIASAASAQEGSSTTRNSCGSQRWSMTRTAPAASRQIER
jgi:hypothetical protein